MVKDNFPREIDCRKELRHPGHYKIFFDNKDFSQGNGFLPSGLEKLVNYREFISDFMEGAEMVVYERPGESDIVYRKENDQVRNGQRLFLYKLV